MSARTVVIGALGVARLFFGARSFAALSFAALAFGALSLSARTADACRFLPTELHQVRPELAGVDTSAPGVPQVVGVDTYRRTGMTCTDASCVANTCGDTGTVRIELAPALGDAEPVDSEPVDSEPVGYRLIAVSGVVPASIAPLIGVDLAGRGPLYLRPSFAEVPDLDLTLSAVAIDAAGNESEPTEAFRVQFDGCTLAAVGDACEDAVDPAEDLSALVDGTSLADEGLAVEAGGASCSFGAARRTAGLPCFAALAFGALSIARRRRRA